MAKHDPATCYKCRAVPSTRDGGWCASPEHPSYMADGKCGHLYDFRKDGSPAFAEVSR